MRAPTVLPLVVLSLISRSQGQSACGCIDTIMKSAHHWANVVANFLIERVRHDIRSSGQDVIKLKDINLPSFLGSGISVSSLALYL